MQKAETILTQEELFGAYDGDAHGTVKRLLRERGFDTDQEITVTETIKGDLICSGMLIPGFDPTVIVKQGPSEPCSFGEIDKIIAKGEGRKEEIIHMHRGGFFGVPSDLKSAHYAIEAINQLGQPEPTGADPNKVVMDSGELHIEATPGHMTIVSKQNGDIDRFTNSVDAIMGKAGAPAPLNAPRLPGGAVGDGQIQPASNIVRTKEPDMLKCSNCGAMFSRDLVKSMPMYMCIHCHKPFHPVVEITAPAPSQPALSGDTQSLIEGDNEP